MKNLLPLLICLILVSCNQDKNEQFVLVVKVKGDYNDYLYLIYDNKIDSSKIVNGRSEFSGTVDVPIKAGFITNRVSGYDRDFYLENTSIEMEVLIEEDSISDWIIIENISGTLTESIIEEVKKIRNSDSSVNADLRLYNKVEEIIQDYPNHQYPGDLLAQMSRDSIFSANKIKSLYAQLNKGVQDPYSIKDIEHFAFPERILEEGDALYDFNLRDVNGDLLSTNDFRGKYILMDFWASWCKPCIDQFPALIQLYNEFEQENFMMIGVALEENEDKWLKAVEKNKLSWPNVIYPDGFTGDMAKEYGIRSIPFNVLIDSEGKIIAKGINLSDLKEFLEELNS